MIQAKKRVKADFLKLTLSDNRTPLAWVSFMKSLWEESFHIIRIVGILVRFDQGLRIHERFDLFK